VTTECCHGFVLGGTVNLIDEVVKTYGAFKKLVVLRFQDERMDNVELGAALLNIFPNHQS
jgi:hypothetical protein